MIKKILVANRGEIALRIMRSCRELGIKTIAVFSDADRKAMHVRYADEAYRIGPAPSAESYLQMDRLIDTAIKAQADAIHPGYGFLSENADFAEKCAMAGLQFIGPSPEAIRIMGDKITARAAMHQAGIPVVPGTSQPLQNTTEALEKAIEIGFPVLLKAAAGGGGKGMRLVHEPEAVASAFQAASREAQTAFGNANIYIEKYILSPHHIEFQILADQQGHTVHLFERECSLQRRHQKIIEETPSPLLTDSIRREMGEKAIAAARAVHYEGAGTIEFIVDEQLNYYFLEMNTRLQVEHPITERVVGIDLVKAQIDIANNLPLAFVLEDLLQQGHAIECRIYAEDPDQDFLPSPGLVKHISEPLGLGVRTDGYVYEGYQIPVFYDPLISKLIVWARTRKEAIGRMQRALYEYKITGVRTNIQFLEKVLETETFRKGKYNTHFIDDHRQQLFMHSDCDGLCEDIALITAFMAYQDQLLAPGTTHPTDRAISPWKLSGRDSFTSH